MMLNQFQKNFVIMLFCFLNGFAKITISLKKENETEIWKEFVSEVILNQDIVNDCMFYIYIDHYPMPKGVTDFLLFVRLQAKR